jgi:hypothetical protein
MDAAARHAEIKRRYKRHAEEARQLGGKRRKFNFAARRITELNSLFTSRYDMELPIGRIDLVEIMLHHIGRARRDDAAPYMRWWISKRAPWFDVIAAETIERVIANPLKFRAGTAGKRVGLLEAERSALMITTIASIDVTKEQRAKRRQHHTRERKRAQRRAEGASPRAEYEARSLSRAKPWKALGISRRTWYRRRGTSPSAA